MKIGIKTWTLRTLTIMSLASAMGQDNDPIQKIKERFASINQDDSYKIVTLDNEEFLEQMTDGGGQLRGYSKDDSIF